MDTETKNVRLVKVDADNFDELIDPAPIKTKSPHRGTCD